MIYIHSIFPHLRGSLSSAQEVNERCPKPCPVRCSPCVAQGVNVFGYDGFRDDEAVDVAVRDLFARGVRHFRVVNVGAWADVVLAAIDRVAEGYADASVPCEQVVGWMSAIHGDPWVFMQGATGSRAFMSRRSIPWALLHRANPDTQSPL